MRAASGCWIDLGGRGNGNRRLVKRNHKNNPAAIRRKTAAVRRKDQAARLRNVAAWSFVERVVLMDSISIAISVSKNNHSVLLNGNAMEKNTVN